MKKLQVSNRHQPDPNKWHWIYTDQVEAELAISMLGTALDCVPEGIDLPSIDAFLESDRIHEQERRDQLIEERRLALSAYSSNQFELAVARLVALHRECDRLGMADWIIPRLKEAKSFRVARGRNKGVRNAKAIFFESLKKRFPAKTPAHLASYISCNVRTDEDTKLHFRVADGGKLIDLSNQREITVEKLREQIRKSLDRSAQGHAAARPTKSVAKGALAGDK